MLDIPRAFFSPLGYTGFLATSHGTTPVLWRCDQFKFDKNVQAPMVDPYWLWSGNATFVQAQPSWEVY